MSKQSMTKERAEKLTARHRGAGKTIYLDGTFTLSIAAAADYLVNHQGYIFQEKEKEKQ